MSFQPDWSIQQRIKQDNKYADAQAYSRKMQDIAKTSNWYERQQKFEVARNNMRSENLMAEEVQIANRELKDRRKARLRQLLQREAEMYEAELMKKGLAIYRDRL